MLILEEAWVFLDHPVFAARIREWLKVLRKKNVSVVFATQSLSDIADSAIAPDLIESCPSRLFLPNPRATETQQLEAYRRFGLNDTQVSLIAQATPKRDYYFQSPSGNRLFDLTLGPVALAFCGASSPEAIARANALVTNLGGQDFASAWLRDCDLDWAADLLASQPTSSSKGDHPCLD